MPGREHFKETDPFSVMMTSDRGELVLLGKQMEKLRSGDQLKQNHRQSDPVQFEEKSMRARS
ncbi:hypothetical protein E2R51_06970 [Jeotgalibacillus sp. S-D1]|uniref:hypothetical protein n=1 Tax=Jeotgalibacillus sp. S-D1 TaxID=2552189 RepID=UPI00105A5B9C|nr:hypothetical protein [Jeotgalibacillus sp. S-D1]TDL35444.1 hypothetical protein E2R51_06970 [Jeotgalibacillus sp. S-D1]